MKVILVGYPGSQQIRKASEYLTKKYLPAFEVIYLNYKGEINGWAKFVSDYLKSIPDERVVFALDDYFVADKMDMDKFLSIDETVPMTKLCHASDEENYQYPITTQYTLWNKQYLIEMLSHVNTPWEFETQGSAIYKKRGDKGMFVPCLKYYTNSALSSRWEGISFYGLKEHDMKLIKTLI